MNDFNTLSNSELENMWQTQASIIKNTLMEYYSSEPTNESLRDKAIIAQELQEEIQKEITKRGV